MSRLLFFVLVFILKFGAVMALPVSKPDRALMVQFSKPVEQAVLEELTAYRFVSVKALNVDNTIYKFSYVQEVLNDAAALKLVQALPYFMLSQEDGLLEMRKTFPNDTLYSKQWYLGIIRAAEAWDITRSGVNRRGDTIVVAVIDDGLRINHPDFQGNIWINYADTIGNGIDDDGNGYIDDHYGWNFQGNNNDISDSSGSYSYNSVHGTPVAGIIGAKTNNITGVSGIMWHVKLMIVTIADTGDFPLVFQSDAIRSYSYVLQQKKLYLSSGGKKGAFVVVSNSSWGANGKFPHQVPLWCAMYDSLGKYGVMNVIAATNNEGLVDTEGDIPTLCPSKHLIAVASTSSGDGFAPSGYSTTHVDMSAPAYGIFNANAYTNFNISKHLLYNSSHSGTSFAAPMVTAAIGILHTYACERILDSIKANPAKGNELMRKFLLEGVDVLPTLAGKNATSGRLNILGAIRVMEKYCKGDVGINNIAGIGRMLLFPNPGNGSIHVVSAVPVLSVTCFDITGKQIPVSLNGLDFSLNHVENGIYFIRIDTGDMVQTVQYVKADQ
jgi:hypothetical protein